MLGFIEDSDITKKHADRQTDEDRTGLKKPVQLSTSFKFKTE